MAIEGRKKIGVIGGLGPSASARLYERITELTEARCDQDHLELVVFSCPRIPDRTDFLLGKPGAKSFVEPMGDLACKLEELGCEVLAAPCNTSHARLGEISRGLTSAHFVSMIDATAREVAQRGGTVACVLATDGTRAAKVYDNAFRAAGIETRWPDEEGQREVMHVIYDQVKAGQVPDADLIKRVCDSVLASGAEGSQCDAFVLACTELSVIGMPGEYRGFPVIDALDALARACIIEAGATVKRDGLRCSGAPPPMQ